MLYKIKYQDKLFALIYYYFQKIKKVNIKNLSLWQKRLIYDYKKFKEDKSNKLINFGFHEDSILKASAVILGPPDTCWSNSIICLELQFNEQYPIQPPNVICTGMKPFHPNFYQDGRICLDILQKNWTSSCDIMSLLISIQSLLDDPNPCSPANYEAAQLYVNDRNAYEQRVKQFGEQCWDNIEDKCYVDLVEPLIENLEQ